MMIISCCSEQKITMITTSQKYLIYLIINPKSFFSDEEIFVLLNHILRLKIHLNGSLMIKMVHNIYGYKYNHHS